MAKPVAHVERAVGEREPLRPAQRLGQPLELTAALGHGALGLGEPTLLHAAVAAVGHVERLAVTRQAARGVHLRRAGAARAQGAEQLAPGREVQQLARGTLDDHHPTARQHEHVCRVAQLRRRELCRAAHTVRAAERPLVSEDGELARLGLGLGSPARADGGYRQEALREGRRRGGVSWAEGLGTGGGRGGRREEAG